MQINFEYSAEKDIWCLRNKGSSSRNNPNPTNIYTLLISQYGENPTEEMTALFIDAYCKENHLDMEEYITTYRTDWETISHEYEQRASTLFKTTLPHEITAYLTINNRNPYDIAANLFYVSVPAQSSRRTIMHELWHFYTWYGLGPDQEKILGSERYNELKEALTALLNVVCADLLPEGVSDVGYPQHKALRAHILDLWTQEQNIHSLWNRLAVLHGDIAHIQ